MSISLTVVAFPAVSGSSMAPLTCAELWLYSFPSNDFSAGFGGGRRELYERLHVFAVIHAPIATLV